MPVNAETNRCTRPRGGLRALLHPIKERQGEKTRRQISRNSGTVKSQLHKGRGKPFRPSGKSSAVWRIKMQAVQISGSCVQHLLKLCATDFSPPCSAAFPLIFTGSLREIGSGRYESHSQPGLSQIWNRFCASVYSIRRASFGGKYFRTWKSFENFHFYSFRRF